MHGLRDKGRKPYTAKIIGTWAFFVCFFNASFFVVVCLFLVVINENGAHIFVHVAKNFFVVITSRRRRERENTRLLNARITCVSLFIPTGNTYVKPIRQPTILTTTNL